MRVSVGVEGCWRHLQERGGGFVVAPSLDARWQV